MENREADNRRAIEAARSTESKNDFLTKEQGHILALLRRVTGKGLTESDDEWMVALMSVSEALDSYNSDRGSFWNYAALVMKSRLTDYYRSHASGNSAELLTEPAGFNGEPDDEAHSAISTQLEIAEKTAVREDDPLRDEIEALTDELKGFDIDFFDLADVSPKTVKTRESCAEILITFFLPPPLVELLRKSGKWPVKELLMRKKLSRKQMDNHRKYLIAAALILSGDYPMLSEYLPLTKR